MALEDYTGKKFGELTVIKRLPSERRTVFLNRMWLCRCSCGKEIKLTTHELFKFTNCGCRGGRRGRIHNLVGEVYGNLEVIKQLPSDRTYGRPARLWLCRCKCGNTIALTTAQLHSNRYRDCGCTSELPKKRFINLKGQKLGHLLVLNRYYNPMDYTRVYWTCKCDCGEEIVTTTSALMRGKENCGWGCPYRKSAASNKKNKVNKDTNVAEL